MIHKLFTEKSWSINRTYVRSLSLKYTQNDVEVNFGHKGA